MGAMVTEVKVKVGDAFEEGDVDRHAPRRRDR